jgi:diaminohydroxyphosphoribosylaminopyrimidine deaminase / 5-amino-6-(5-phosphoribosylamino)uracil reductase
MRKRASIAARSNARAPKRSDARGRERASADINDEKFMARALRLARSGVALASPNPMVGAVVVRSGHVVGEGFHSYAEKKHAEVVALERAGEKARGATLYVNLEPCCHMGRTGPCSRAVIAARIRRVVVGMRDPNPEVAGGGVRELRHAGIEAREAVMEREARELNEAFAKWITTKRPMVTMKSALTLDAQIGDGSGSTTFITSEASRAEVQRLRHAADALVSGIGTVLADDPMLTDRSGLKRRRPLLRVILDSELRIPAKAKLVESARGDLLVVTAAAVDSARARKLRAKGVEVVRMSRGRDGGLDLKRVMEELGKREISSVLLEGGSRLNGAALAAGIVDKVILFYAPKILGSDAAPWVIVPGAGRGVRRGGPRGGTLKLPALSDVKVRRFGPDICVEGYLRDVYGNH